MRTRKRAVTAKIPNSTIRKTVGKALGRWRKYRPVLAAGGRMDARRSPGEVINKKIMQVSTGRALDAMQIFEKKKRARINRLTQDFVRGKSQEHFLKNIRPALEKELGKEGANEFVLYLSAVQAPNNNLAREIFIEERAKDDRKAGLIN